MSDPFVAEIRLLPFNFAPMGWAFCQGQILPISQNTALFSLLGTFYGGNGQTTFALPNLMGSAAIHQGQGPGLSLRTIGETGGTETVTLLNTEIPSHSHMVSPLAAAPTADTTPPPAPGTTVPAGPSLGDPATTYQAYSTQVASGTPMKPTPTDVAGASFPHNNMPPYLVLNPCIALQGIYPARN
ncbi:MAG: phage tail protein [Holophagaceae bacterium]|nr:phage tail protein [Holophagaceae bacterium]